MDEAFGKVQGPRVSAIVVNYNGGSYLSDCVESLQSQQETVEIIVVDNASYDDSIQSLRDVKGVRIIQNTSNLGFAGGANTGAAFAQGRILLFLNPDVRLDPRCVSSLGDTLVAERGVVGPVLEVLASGSTEYGGIIDVFGYPAPLTSRGEPLFVPGCALATNADLFQELGGFDDRYFMFVEDVDYCWRVLLRGGKVVVDAKAMARHAGGASTPGGYGAPETGSNPSAFRFVLRERNSLAMLLKCTATPKLPIVVPAYIVQALGTALAVALMGKVSVSLGILKGLFWNVAQLPETLRLRKQASAGRRSARVLRGMIQWRSNKLVLLVRRGLPRFIES